MAGKELKVLKKGKLDIFKIVNRKGYAAVCDRNLTEGKTPQEAYFRMQKALKRAGFRLEDISADELKKMVKK